MQDRMNIYFEYRPPRPAKKTPDGVIAIAVLGICFLLGALTTLGVVALVVLAR